MPPPRATVRTQAPLPVLLADGRTANTRVFTFDGLVDGREHLAVALGTTTQPGRPGGHRPLVRLHSECLTGDVLGSERCDCGPQLSESLQRLHRSGGYLLYLRQEGRDIGLYAKLDAYLLQDSGLDTYEANRALGFAEDARDYTVAAQMLLALGVSDVALLSNNPDKASQLERHGVTVGDRVRTDVHLTATNARYLAAKVRYGRHRIRLPWAVTAQKLG
jgi:GTP cyclohydrolase II